MLSEWASGMLGRIATRRLQPGLAEAASLGSGPFLRDRLSHPQHEDSVRVRRNPQLPMRFLDDLLAIGLATGVLLVLLVLFPHTPLRIVLGLPFVLFFPGYTLISALYPRRSDLEGIERLALSLGLSLAVTPLVGLVLNYTPWGIRLVPILGALTLFIAACSLVAGFKRRQLSETERFPADVRPVLRTLRGLPWTAVGVSAGVIAVVLLLGFRFGVLGGSRIGEAFTEFYILGPGGKAEGYPRRLIAGQPGEVILGIINHEGRAANYLIQVKERSELLKAFGPIALEDAQKWESKAAFAPRHPGQRVKVEFLLFRDGSPAPYRSLHLWLEVMAL